MRLNLSAGEFDCGLYAQLVDFFNVYTFDQQEIISVRDVPFILAPKEGCWMGLFLLAFGQSFDSLAQ